MDTQYHSTSSNNTSIYFDLLPEGPDNETVSRMRDELVKNAGDWPMLRRRLTKVFGGDAALFLEHLIFWSGKSHAPDGWVYKSREEMEDVEEGIGLGNRYQTKARKVLRGEKQAPKVVEECRPSRRRATFYRVDLVAVANIIGVELLSAIEDDIDFLDLGESESFRGTTQNEQTPDKPSESFQGTTESFQGATESFRVATSVDTSVGTNSGSTLQVGAEPAKAEPAPLLINKDKEPKEGLAPPSEDKRHSENGHTASETTAVRDEVEEVVAPPKPNDDTLLAEVREILDPEAGRWWGAKFISERRKDYAPGAVATIMLNSVEDIEETDTITEADKTELMDAVRYVMWQAEEEVGSSASEAG